MEYNTDGRYSAYQDSLVTVVLAFKYPRFERVSVLVEDNLSFAGVP
jgi:hypothetical protein